MNRQQLRAALKAARRAPKPVRRAADPNAALNLLRTTRAATSIDPLDQSQLTDLALGHHSALHALMHGAGSWDDCNTLACAANVTLLLHESGIGHFEEFDGMEDEELRGLQDAQNAVFVAMTRGKSTGRYLLTGVEIRALQFLVEFHDWQLADPECTEARIVAALSQIKRRVLAGNVLEMA